MTDTFDPRYSIDRSFQVLAARLEPIIAGKLAPHLVGLPWTVILQERDRLRGKTPGIYEASDPQAQLKVLTERLGSIGFPFDDQTRTISVLGGELRIARNRWAHHGDLTALDAWRTSDFAVRLLERLGDADGVILVDDVREEAFAAVVREKGIAEHAVPVVETDSGAPIADRSFILRGHGSGLDSALVESSISTSPFDPAGREDHVDSFEPWPVVAVGDTSVIDELPKKWAKERVRAVAAEIVDYEGPIQLRRLAQLTAASFGVTRLSEKREKKIVYQLRQSGEIVVDSDKFAWPAGADPAQWPVYRQNDASVQRDLLAISPVEIANAMREVGRRHPEYEDEAVDRAALAVFGKSRLTASFRAHLQKARKLLASNDET